MLELLENGFLDVSIPCDGAQTICLLPPVASCRKPCVFSLLRTGTCHQGLFSIAFQLLAVRVEHGHEQLLFKVFL